MTSLRVALVAGSLGAGGSERQLFYIARALREHGCEVRVYSLTSGEVYESKLRDLGVEVYWIGRRSNPPLRLATFIRQLRVFRPQVIQTMHSFTNLYAALAARAVGAVSIGALRCDLSFCQDSNGGWTKWLLRLPHRLAVNSRTIAALAASGTAALPSSTRWLPNCVDTGKFIYNPPSSKETFTALAAGRLVPVKRIDVFLSALALARKVNPRVRGLIAGDGSEMPRALALASELGLLPNGVTFLGKCEHMPSAFARADAMVLCSGSEGSPNVILEAMASGVPVISTPAGDAETMIQHGSSGYIVDFSDSQGIAQRLVQLSTSPDVCRSFSEAGRQQVDLHFDTQHLFQRLFELYLEVAQQKNRSAIVDALRVLAPHASQAGTA